MSPDRNGLAYPTAARSVDEATQQSVQSDGVGCDAVPAQIPQPGERWHESSVYDQPGKWWHESSVYDTSD